MTIGEDKLMAYVDGELDAADNARVEAALAEDATLRERVETMRTLRGELADHFNPVLSEPMPDRFEALVRSGGNSSTGAAAGGPGWRERLLEGWRAPQWAALAAALILGVGVGTQFAGDGTETPFTVEDGRMTASVRLAGALDRPGPGQGDIAVQVSFRRSDGGYCRTFTASGTAGIACRENDAWQLEMLAPATAQDTQIRTAGSALPPAVLERLDTLIEGDALSADEEAEAAERGWRPQ